MKITGLMGAMPEEMVRIVAMMEQRTERTIGNRTYHEGLIDGMPVVAVFSRWGKVAAATTATTLIEIFGVEQLIFTGIAGALAPCLSVGDVVVADCLVQHDMDARPLMSRYEVPLTGKQFFETDVLLSKAVEQAAANMLLNEEAFLLLSGEDGLQKPSVIREIGRAHV